MGQFSYFGNLKQTSEYPGLALQKLLKHNPRELENLTLVATLNLSFNHLCGEGGVFNNVTEISHIGNKDLLGAFEALILYTKDLLDIRIAREKNENFK
ncbi:hypothetical protein CR513_18079, partial [Mucuna pruriens]